MAKTTGISWTDSTFNPWIGCTRVGPGCDHCYAAVSTPARAMNVKWGAGEPRRRTSPDLWKQPIKWNYATEGKGKPHYVFCASLADVFDNEAPDAWRSDLWELFTKCPFLTWQIVTKRAGNVRKMVPQHWLDRWPANVWLIATMVNQEEFDRDWPKLREIPARVLGLSIEPMLGMIKFPDDVRGKLHWAIYGGESRQPGHEPRECRLEWIVDGIRQCRELGIAPFVKQAGHICTDAVKLAGGAVEYLQVSWGAGKRDNPAQWPAQIRIQEFPT